MSLENFDDFTSDYLKGSDLKEDKADLFVTEITEGQIEGKPQLILTVDYADKSWSFPLNKTNATKVAELVKKPLDLKNKTISVKKVLVTNPTTKKEVDGIRITAVK